MTRVLNFVGMADARSATSIEKGNILLLRADCLQRCLNIPENAFRPVDRCGPAGSICDHSADFGIEVGRVGFVARAEVEDLAGAAGIAATTAKHLASLEPRNEDECFRLRDVEVLAVHLLPFHLDVLADPLDDRMSGRDHPEPL